MVSLETLSLGPSSQAMFERLERLVGLPPGVGDHGNRGVADLHDVAHAGHRLGLGLVVALDLGAEHRRIHDRGVEHAGQLDVDGVDLLAGELVDGVEALHAACRRSSSPWGP